MRTKLETELTARGLELSTEMDKPVHGFNVLVARASDGQPEEREFTYERKDGSHLTVNLPVTSSRDGDGALNVFLGIT